MLFIGIDPGVKGGMAFYNEKTLNVFPMPIIGDKEYDIQRIREILFIETTRNLKEAIFATIEKQHCMPGEGLPRTFKTGMGFGILLGMFHGLEIPFQIVSAKEWQSKIFRGLPAGQDTKVSSVLIATRTFPGVDFRRSAHSKNLSDGLTDATCIALYTQRFKNNTLGGVEQNCVHRVLPENPTVCIACGTIL